MVSCTDFCSDSDVDMHTSPVPSQTVQTVKQSSVLKSSKSKYCFSWILIIGSELIRGVQIYTKSHAKS